MPRLKSTYEKEIVTKLMSKLSLKNKHDVPKIEKIILNSALHEDFSLLNKMAHYFGNQAVVVSVDVVYNIFNKPHVSFFGARKKSNYNPFDWASLCAENGAGELIITSVKKEGTWSGYDLELIKKIAINKIENPIPNINK